MAVRHAVAIALLGWLGSACSATIPEGIFACTEASDCPDGWACVEGFCYSSVSGNCIRADCATLGHECGQQIDNCAQQIDCGSCPDTEPFCTAGQCGNEPCTPDSDPCAGAECGFASDGCNAVVACGSCTGNERCSDNICMCLPDSYEKHMVNAQELTNNDSEQRATELAMEASEIVLSDANLHAATDNDFYFISDLAAGDFVLGEVSVTVALRNIPKAANYDLQAKIVCDGGEDGMRCDDSGSPIDGPCIANALGNSDETLTVKRNCDSTKPVRVYVGVINRLWADACAPYALEITQSNLN